MITQTLRYIFIVVLLLQQAFGLLLNQSRLEKIQAYLDADLEIICTNSQMRLISISQTEAKGYFVFVDSENITLDIDELCPKKDGISHSLILSETTYIFRSVDIFAAYYTTITSYFFERLKYQLPENKAPPISLI
jgi:hypothetical protein